MINLKTSPKKESENLTRRFLIFIGMALLLWGHVDRAFARVLAGSAAPDFKLTGLDSKEYSLSNYLGKVVFVNFIGWS